MIGIAVMSLLVIWLFKPSWSDKRRAKRLKQEQEEKLPRVHRVNGKKVL
jgi:hypothetical protein